MVELLEQQQAALQHVRKRAMSNRSLARLRASKAIGSEPDAPALFDTALVEIQKHAPVDVNFHPDRLDSTGKSIADELLASGVYRNQFETGISNGGVTAFEGGQRDIWEASLFGGAYQRPGTVAAIRPKYGGLNLAGHWDGACPRFGSCYFRLKLALIRFPLFLRAAMTCRRMAPSESRTGSSGTNPSPPRFESSFPRCW